MPDERVDLAQRERDRGPAVEIAAQKAVGRHAELECRGGGVLDGGSVAPQGRQWFDGIRIYAAASSPTRSRRT